ncbi:hypothetical protein BGZ73_004578 [Actinomortierella ambigua]|nr:hypothetical protein BGZ73_004578 [Actinomortierella ambigua]
MSSRNVTKTDSLQQSCDDQVILSSNEHDESSSDNYHIESDDDDFFVLDKDDMPSEPGASSASAAGIVAETSSKREADQLKVAEGQVIRGYLHGRKEDLEFQRELHLDQEHRLEKLSSSEMVLHTYNNKGMISSAPKGQPEVNPESLPEDLSARFSSSVRRNLSSDTTHLDKLGFRLVANFSSVASGQYSLHLLIKQASDEMAAARFCVRVVVRYPMTRMSQVFYTRFFKSSRDDGSNWCFLKAEGQVEIYPQVGSAQLNVNIAPDDAFLEYSGTLMIRSILLVPIGTKPVSSADTPGSPRNNTKADRTLASNDTLSWRPSNDTLSWRATIAEGDGQIVRLATSKNGAFLAALSTFANQFMVHVWHMDDLKTDQSNSTFTDVARAGFASEPISCPGARGLPLELAISATGEYVAVFQAPMIGDWLEGSSVPKSAVGVRLFRRPRTSSEQIFVPVDSRSPVSNVLSIQDTPASLKHAVGYAVFAGELTTGTNRTPARFVHCNGLYLEVYVLNENGIQRGLTIPLTSLSSALLRTTACELMMRSIVANMFIWVEDNGRYCSTWDLNNGAALGRIEITSRLFHGSSAGVSEMNIACSRNIVAIVGFDNSITTIDATSGVLLSRRTIYDRIIEHIAFPSAHSQMLVVMLRAEDENKQTGLILDPLCLDVQEYSLVNMAWSLGPRPAFCGDLMDP